MENCTITKLERVNHTSSAFERLSIFLNDVVHPRTLIPNFLALLRSRPWSDSRFLWFFPFPSEVLRSFQPCSGLPGPWASDNRYQPPHTCSPSQGLIILIYKYDRLCRKTFWRTVRWLFTTNEGLGAPSGLASALDLSNDSTQYFHQACLLLCCLRSNYNSNWPLFTSVEVPLPCVSHPSKRCSSSRANLTFASPWTSSRAFMLRH